MSAIETAYCTLRNSVLCGIPNGIVFLVFCGISTQLSVICGINYPVKYGIYAWKIVKCGNFVKYR